MDITADMLRKFIALGLNNEQVLGVIEIYDSLNLGDDERKAKNRERVRRWRERLDLSSKEWRDRKNFVLSRDNYTCVYCGSTDNLHVDHAIPLVHGGSSEVENLVTACRECNCGKSGRTVEEWRGGK